MDIVRALLDDVHGVTFIAYNLFLIPVTFFSFIYYMAALRGIFGREEKDENNTYSQTNWPNVTIQIPTYNEPVAIRCAKSCLEFD